MYVYPEHHTALKDDTSLPLFPDSPWLRRVLTLRVLSISQIDRCEIMYKWFSPIFAFKTSILQLSMKCLKWLWNKIIHLHLRHLMGIVNWIWTSFIKKKTYFTSNLSWYWFLNHLVSLFEPFKNVYVVFFPPESYSLFERNASFCVNNHIPNLPPSQWRRHKK